MTFRLPPNLPTILLTLSAISTIFFQQQQITQKDSLITQLISARSNVDHFCPVQATPIPRPRRLDCSENVYDAEEFDISSLRGKVGKSAYVEVTGSENGSVYGTDYYTSDSNLATACVHAGILQDGQTGMVKVTMLPQQENFKGSTHNGVTSSSWRSSYGAFKVEAVGQGKLSAEVFKKAIKKAVDDIIK